MKRLVMTVLVLSGCVSVEAARIALPSELQTGASRVAASGIDGGRGGEVAFGPLLGEWRRNTTEQRFAGRYEVFESESGFDGELGGAALSMRCRMRQQDVREQLGDGWSTSAAMVPLRYACAFTGPAAPADAAFELGTVLNEGIGSVRRYGEIVWNGERLALDSVHRFENGPRSDGALGYTISTGTGPLALLDQLGSGSDLVIREGLGAPSSDAVFVAGLALALLQDPETP